MNRPTKVILLDTAKIEFERLNQIVGQQVSAGKENELINIYLRPMNVTIFVI